MERPEISEIDLANAANRGKAKELGSMARELGPERLGESRFQSAGQIAIEGDRAECLEALLDAGWAPDRENRRKRATHLAARADALGCLRVLLDRGFPAGERGENGEGPAHWAAGAGRRRGTTRRGRGRRRRCGFCWSSGGIRRRWICSGRAR